MELRAEVPGGGVIEARRAMNTRFEVLLPGPDAVRLRAAAEEALDEIERLEAQLSIYRAESEVSGINARAAAEPVRVEPRLFRLLRTALDVTAATDGAFDIAIAPLLQAWGFLGASGRMPDRAELEAAREIAGSRWIVLDEEAMTVRFLRPGVRIDLGAIGKGYALDRARERLEDAGIVRGLLHAGTSSVLALGSQAAEAGWRVAIRDPLGDREATLAEVRLQDRALSVSGPHGKAFREGDRLYGHVLDPRTGEPARAARLAAVAHPSATLTDALSTALLVLGPEGLERLAARYPDADFLVVAGDDRALEAHTAGPNRWRLVLTVPSAGPASGAPSAPPGAHP